MATGYCSDLAAAMPGAGSSRVALEGGAEKAAIADVFERQDSRIVFWTGSGVGKRREEEAESRVGLVA